MDTRCRIEMLGELKLLQGDRAITRFRTYKTGVLLAYLAFYRQRAHPREELIALLWPDCEPEAGRNSLSQALSSLRNQLEPPGVPAGAILRADRASVQIVAERVATDVVEFEAALRAAGQAGANAVLLAEAVERYGGELLPGYYEDWNLQERAYLQEAYLQAVSRLVRLLEQAGDQERALAYARRAVQADPLREEAQETLIRLYAAAGQPEAARRQFQQMEQTLAKELGASPGSALRAFVQQLPKEGAAPPLPSPSRSARSRVPALPTGTVTFLRIEA
ncbi:MAG TPA: BTAD domain-containing putative transcriptional regulator, partial [Chthonomonadaceae bacterium]|nr:BTAD domain-containing putative transcriptional regulator [Chthonomonadaceae bacterium]